MKKEKKTQSERFNKKSIKIYILQIFNQNPNKPLNYKQISAQIGVVKVADKQLVLLVLDELSELKIIEEVERGKYRLISKQTYRTGKVEMKLNGSAKIVTQEDNQDVLITQRNLNHALPGDYVRICLYAENKRRELEGEVVEIIQRANNIFVGTVEITKGFAFFIPDKKSILNDIFLPPDSLKGIKNGQKALVKITEWPAKSKNPIGEIVEVLGNAGEHQVEMNAIMAEFELPIAFPKNVEKAANAIPNEITEDEISKRRDFREITTITIDPINAKDFDDALSLQTLANGNFEVGVHIADVTHYVPDGSVLDVEAKNRATSVYLVDRVIPMLPEKLSNGLCSLRPNEDKLCFSAVFEISPDGKIKNEWFGKTIIHSNRRFNYEEAQDIIDKQQGDYVNELTQLNILAKKLRSFRFKKGALGFDRVEVKFELSPEGKPLRVYFTESKDAHRLIEEFMLLANQKVAEYAGKAKPGVSPKTYVYRIHDKPDEQKLGQFAGFIKQFGYKINTQGSSAIAKSMNKLFEELEGKPEKEMIENLAIRSMARAIYSTKNIGHYGLAFQYYSHFTSPIRRYPDMMAHRLLFQYLNGGRSVNANEYEKICKHASNMEQIATEAERASIKYKQAEFLMDKKGIPFEGVISGVTEWGLFVMIKENHCEGMIPLRTLTDDFYIFDEKKMMIYAKHSNKKYMLGDTVTIVITKVNLQKKQVDMAFVEEE